MKIIIYASIFFCTICLIGCKDNLKPEDKKTDSYKSNVNNVTVNQENKSNILAGDWSAHYYHTIFPSNAPSEFNKATGKLMLKIDGSFNYSIDNKNCS